MRRIVIPAGELAVARAGALGQKFPMRLPCRFLVTGAALLAATLAPAKTLIHAGSLIDGRADTVRKAVTLTVDGERITGLADGYTAPAAGDTVIDLKNATVMPGLMDMHVHITGEQSGQAGYAERFYLNPADVALRATTYAKKTLLAGFTTVRDCGAGDKLNLSMRDAIAKGWVDGPRIFAAGSVSTTGGHGDGTNVIALDAGAGFSFRYGPGSYRRHRAEAERVCYGRRNHEAGPMKFEPGACEPFVRA